MQNDHKGVMKGIEEKLLEIHAEQKRIREAESDAKTQLEESSNASDTSGGYSDVIHTVHVDI